MSHARIPRDNSSHDFAPQRESRIHSIYEKYLYDPKDLDSADPKIRALARNASKNQHQNMSARANKKRQSSVMFARGTKGDDGRPDASTMPRGSTGSAYDGFGALMDAYSDDSDDDSDDGSRQQQQPRTMPANAAQAMPNSVAGVNDGHPRESWGARAEAVGQRPPDSASQNPPSLKLLGLKSQREGGSALGASARTAARPSFDAIPEAGVAQRPNPPQRNMVQEQSMSEYGDNSSRIGSTIEFGAHQGHAGHGSDGFGGITSSGSGGAYGRSSQSIPLQQSPLSPGLQPPPPTAPIANHNPRSALTAQLGLDTPQPEPSPSANRSPANDYFAQTRDGQRHEIPLERNTSNESSHYGAPRAPESAMLRQHSNGPSESFSSNSSGSPPRNPFGDGPPGRPLVSPPRGHVGAGPSPPMPAQSRPAPPAGFHGPPRPQQNGMAPPPNSMPFGAGPGPQPRPRPANGPGFSDAQGPPQQRRQSIFRRSMAFMTGGNAGEGPNTGGPQPRPSRDGGNRQSIFRRSMAFLSGKSTAQAPPPTAENDDANCPAPRVRGFDEKEPDNRKSQFWGGGGVGSEWDTDGAGSKFWRRFSAAQKHAQNPGDKMELKSRSFRRKIEAQKKTATWVAGVGGVLIIAAVIGIVIWRESKSSPQDQNPGAINKGDHGGTDTRARRAPIQTSLPSAELEYYQKVANEAMWARARVGDVDDEAAGESSGRAVSPPAATPAAVAPSHPSTRRRMKRHANLHRQLVEQTP